MVMGLLPARRGGVFLVCFVACVIGVQAVDEVDVDSALGPATNPPSLAPSVRPSQQATTATPAASGPATAPPAVATAAPGEAEATESPKATKAPAAAIGEMQQKLQDLQRTNEEEAKKVADEKQGIAQTKLVVATASNAAGADLIQGAETVLDPNNAIVLAQRNEKAAEAAKAALAKKIQQIQDGNTALIKDAHAKTASAKEEHEKAAENVQNDEISTLQKQMDNLKKTSTAQKAALEAKIESKASKRAQTGLNKVADKLSEKLKKLKTERSDLVDKIADKQDEEPFGAEEKKVHDGLLQSWHARMSAIGLEMKQAKLDAAEDTKAAKDEIKQAARAKVEAEAQHLRRLQALQKSAKDTVKKAKLAVANAMAGKMEPQDDSSIKQVQAQAEEQLAKKDENKAAQKATVEANKFKAVVQKMTADAAAPLIRAAVQATEQKSTLQIIQKQGEADKTTEAVQVAQTVVAGQTEALKRAAIAATGGNDFGQLAKDRAVTKQKMKIEALALAKQSVAASQVKTLEDDKANQVAKATAAAKSKATADLARAQADAQTQSADAIRAATREADKLKQKSQNELLKSDVTATVEQGEAGQVLENYGNVVSELEDKAAEVRDNAEEEMSDLKAQATAQNPEGKAVITARITKVQAAVAASANKVNSAKLVEEQEKQAGQKLVAEAKANAGGSDAAIQAVSADAETELEKVDGLADESSKTQKTIEKLEAAITKNVEGAQMAKDAITRAQEDEQRAKDTAVLHTENKKVQRAQKQADAKRVELEKKAAEAQSAANEASQAKAKEAKQKADESKPLDIKELRSKRAKLDVQIKALEAKAESTKQAVNEFKTATRMAALMAKRVEKAEYMTKVAKSSLQMSTDEYDLAKASNAQEEVAKAAKENKKYENRISMSEKTESQDKELLELAQKRLTTAKAQFPSAAKEEKIVANLEVQDATLKKEQAADQVELMTLMEKKVTGTVLEAAKVKIGNVAMQVQETEALAKAAKLKEQTAQDEARKVAEAQAKENAEKNSQAKKEQDDLLAYARTEKTNKASGKDAAEALAIKDAVALKALQDKEKFAAEQKRKDTVVESGNKVREAKEGSVKKDEARKRALANKARQMELAQEKIKRELDSKATLAAKLAVEVGKKAEVKLEKTAKAAASAAAKLKAERAEKAGEKRFKKLQADLAEKSAKERQDKKIKAMVLATQQKAFSDEQATKKTAKSHVERATKLLANSNLKFLNVREISTGLHQKGEEALRSATAARAAKSALRLRLENVDKKIDNIIRAEERTDEAAEKKLRNAETEEVMIAKEVHQKRKEAVLQAKGHMKKGAAKLALELAVENLNDKKRAADEGKTSRIMLKASLSQARKKLKDAQVNEVRFLAAGKILRKENSRLETQYALFVEKKNAIMKQQGEAQEEIDEASQAAETQAAKMKESEDKPEYDSALEVFKGLKNELTTTTARVGLRHKQLKRKLENQDKDVAKTGQDLDESRTSVTQNLLSLQKSMRNMKEATKEIGQLLRSKVEKTVTARRDEFLFDQTKIKAAIARARKDIGSSRTDADKALAQASESRSKTALVKLQSTESSIQKPLAKEQEAKVLMARSVQLQASLEAQLIKATLKVEKKKKFEADRNAITNEQQKQVVHAQSQVAHRKSKLEEVKEVAQKAEFAGAQLASSVEAKPDEYEVMELGSL